MKASPRPFGFVVVILAGLLLLLFLGATFILVQQYLSLNQLTPAPQVTALAPVIVVVPGTNQTAMSYPTLPPEWTATSSPTATATAPTPTPSETKAPTLTPTFLPTNTPAPTQAGPTRTRRPTGSPTSTPTRTATPTVTKSVPSATVSTE